MFDIIKKTCIISKETHWTIFKSHPLLGIGYRDNLRSIKEYWPESEVATCRHLRDNGNHAHNQYMNVLATTGILGFLFFIAFYGYFIILNLQLLKIYRNDKLHYPLCVSLLMMQIFFSFMKRRGSNLFSRAENICANLPMRPRE